MRVLLDECVAARLSHDLPDRDVTTVQRMCRGSLNDGVILARAASQFDAFITVDRSIAAQQRVPDDLVFMTLLSRSNTYQSIRPLAPQILQALAHPQPGIEIRIGHPPDAR